MLHKKFTNLYGLGFVETPSAMLPTLSHHGESRRSEAAAHWHFPENKRRESGNAHHRGRIRYPAAPWCPAGEGARDGRLPTEPMGFPTWAPAPSAKDRRAGEPGARSGERLKDSWEGRRTWIKARIGLVAKLDVGKRGPDPRACFHFLPKKLPPPPKNLPKR